MLVILMSGFQTEKTRRIKECAERGIPVFYDGVAIEEGVFYTDKINTPWRQRVFCSPAHVAKIQGTLADLLVFSH